MGRSQFGSTRDDWGNRFLSWNTIPIRHEVLPERYLNRNPNLVVTESVFDIISPGDDGRVFPLTPPPLVFNNESSSHFNALAGLTIYRGDALGEKYLGNAFIGESLRNLVHRRVLTPNGVTFTAQRGEEGKEFLASTDPWFHPVNFTTGPDAALYVVDFYRRFVEHPGFVPGNLRAQIQWRTGAEHGRIWRVHLKKANLKSPTPKPQLSRAGATKAAIRVLKQSASESVRAVLFGLLDPKHAPEVQSAAIGALIDSGDRRSAGRIFTGWSTYSAAVRQQALVKALQSAAATEVLVEALEQGKVLSDELDASTRHALRNVQNPDLAKRAKMILGVDSTLSRDEVVRNFQPTLNMAGDRQRGAATFAKLCLPCHSIQGKGNHVGPDLSGVASRPKEALLVDILDPSRQVTPDFIGYTLTTTQGETVTGLIAAESANSVTMRRAGQADETISRAHISGLRAEGKSLMPDGLAQGLTQQDLAGLLEFLQKPDNKLLTVEE